MKHFDVRDFISGALLIAVGIFVAVYAGTHYGIGQPSRMGPGFFPVALGCILAVLGLIVLLFSFRFSAHAWEVSAIAWRPLAAILAAVAVFSLLVDRFGLVPATVALTFIAALAERRFRLRRTVLLAAALALLSWLIFTVGLQMNLPAFAKP
ncbi:MAG: tripartite tricarboxylate transporter TctB family protein [Caldimonas sp.]